MADDAHAENVERAFTAQAEAFEDATHNRVFTTDARWVFERLPVSGCDLVLDVAAGTGHAARQLAPAARAVIALDATAAMLQRGREAAAQEGVGNVVFMRHDVSAGLPFLDRSFDVAVCRFALHHLAAPGDAVAEMARCLRPGGHVGLADLLAPGDRASAEAQDRLETLRDPSHTHVLAEPELRGLIARAGLELVALEQRGIERPLRPWLEQTRTSPAAAASIEAALRGELDGGPGTGLSPRIVDGELWFTQRFAAAVARRPDDPPQPR